MTYDHNDQLGPVLEKIAAKMERLDRQLNSTDPTNPGLAIRVRDIERLMITIRWLCGGGLFGIASTLYLLWQILEALHAARV